MFKPFTDLLHLFYPLVCAACGEELLAGEERICVNCLLSLPYTGFTGGDANPVEQTFWGRTELEAATALLHFRKGNSTQKLMHEIKYRGEKELAAYIGRLMGQELASNNPFTTVDYILPVPMHKAKQRKRGFNQAEWFAKGLAEKLHAAVNTEVLLKISATNSQTRKNRWQRWKNMEELFVVNQPEKLAGKHILLVDDIVTTGATLEACAQTLKQAANCKVSIATMAMTQ